MTILWGSSRPPTPGQPFAGKLYQGFLDAFVGDHVEGFTDEGGYEK